MLNSQHRQATKKNNAIPSSVAYCFFCCRRAERQPALLWKWYAKACSVFMLSPSSRSTAKPAAAWHPDSNRDILLFILSEAEG